MASTIKCRSCPWKGEPGDLVRLRVWPGEDFLVGECPICHDTISVPIVVIEEIPVKKNNKRH